MRHWVKLWTEMLDDPKMGRLTDRQHRTCTNLFCLAGIIDDEGRLMNTSDIAFKLRREDITELEDDLVALAKVDILEKDNDGIWQLVHFEARNERPPSANPDAVAERVKRHRAKGNTTPAADVTICNEYVTTPQRDVTSLEKRREEEIRLDKTSSSTTAPAPKAIEAFLQARAGAVGPTDVDRIDLMAERATAHITALARGSPGAELTGDAWVAAAIEEAVQSQDGRGISLKYIDAILSRWIAQGFKSEMQHEGKKGNGRIRGQKRISIPGYQPPATETPEEFAALPTSGELEDRARLPGVRGDRLAAS